MRLIALIEAPGTIRRILGHLGHPTEIPEPGPAWSPPLLLGTAADHPQGYDVTFDGGA